MEVMSEEVSAKKPKFFAKRNVKIRIIED